MSMPIRWADIVDSDSESTVASEGDARSTPGAGGYRCDHGKKICGHGDRCRCDAAQLQWYCHNEACRNAKEEYKKEERRHRSAMRPPSWQRRRATTVVIAPAAEVQPPVVEEPTPATRRRRQRGRGRGGRRQRGGAGVARHG
mmetsp:Transcript_5548/g.11511  ORF Transcript_5548/g.11511 Transcript_5548/m.11511 type:complete len:142 (+) Transcript_5548:149-574(+)